MMLMTEKIDCQWKHTVSKVSFWEGRRGSTRYFMSSWVELGNISQQWNPEYSQGCKNEGSSYLIPRKCQKGSQRVLTSMAPNWADVPGRSCQHTGPESGESAIEHKDLKWCLYYGTFWTHSPRKNSPTAPTGPSTISLSQNDCFLSAQTITCIHEVFRLTSAIQARQDPCWRMFSFSNSKWKGISKEKISQCPFNWET